MAAHAGLWEGLIKQHGLKEISLEKLATWKFMGFVMLMPEGGWFPNVTKLRRAGFEVMAVDTRESILAQLQALRDAKVIP